MGTSLVLIRATVSAIMGIMVTMNGAPTRNPTINRIGVAPVAQATKDVYAATKLVCKTGFKAGKTAVSLKVGAKPACVKTKTATAGKKLLTGFANTCFTCHSNVALYPVKLMNTNLRTQGFTLKPASITEAFNLHSAEMSGATITAADAKSISAYLQTIK